MRRSLLGNIVCCLVVALVFILPISVFAQENYTVRYFNMCSDTDAISIVDVTAGNNLALPMEAGENVGFSLFGWYEKDAPTTIFEKGQEITLGENEYDTYDLCALWGRNITYHLNGGENNPNNPTVVYDGRTYNLEDPTRVGYTFEGWYSDESFVNRITEIRGSNTELTDVYAKFEANKYYVAFNSNGGNGSMDEVICEYDTDCELPQNIIQRAGYTWIKWNTKQDGTGTSYNDKAKVRNLTSINTDIVYLHAQYSIIEYTITYYLNGGVNNSGNPTKYTVETSAFDLKTPTRDGYVFDGWYSDSGFTMYALSVTKGTTGNKNFYAKWRAIDYTVTYNLNGGVNNENNPGGYNIEQNVELTNPTRKGYVFGGWYTDSNFTNKVTSIPVGSKGNKTYYAQWVKSSYKINYNANGGKGKMTATTCKANTNCTLRGNSFKRTGYVFVEWNTKKDGTGVSFTNKQVVRNMISGSSITLYARWKPIVYKIAFIANGGTGSMEAIECTYNKNCKLPANVFTRVGYKWTGWNTKSNAKGKNYKNNQTVKNLANTSKTVNLYSKWSKIKYSIKYNLNGGKNNSKNPKLYYVTTSTINFKNPTRKGYNFLGWYKEKEFTNKVTSIPKGSIGNVTLFAKWIKSEYKVSFATNGGSGKMKTITCKINKNCTLTKNSFSRKGYSFAGWNTKADGTGTAYSNKGAINIPVATDTKLYAQWKLNKYSITYKLNGGENNTSNPSTYDITQSVSLKNPTRDGYNFAGWFTDSKFKKKVTSISKGSTGNKTFYAKWSKITFGVNTKDVEIDVNDYGYVLITYTYNKGEVRYKIDDTSVVTADWSDWYGDKIYLFLTAQGPGSTKVTISNSVNSTKYVINVRVRSAWEKTTIEYPYSIGDYTYPSNRVEIQSTEIKKEYSDSWLLGVKFRLIKYGDKSRNTWYHDVEFFDEDGVMIDTWQIKAEHLTLGQVYYDEILVPNEAVRVVFLSNPDVNDIAVPNIDNSSVPHNSNGSSTAWTIGDTLDVSGMLNAAIQFSESAYYLTNEGIKYEDISISDVRDYIHDIIEFLNDTRDIVSHRRDVVRSDGKTLLELIDEALNAYSGYMTADAVTLSNMSRNGYEKCAYAHYLMFEVYENAINGK